jgi:hypothetical protein
MATPSVNTANKTYSSNSAWPLTISHTISGNSNRILIACVVAKRSGTAYTTDVTATFNGVSMNKISGSGLAGSTAYGGIFYLSSLPPAGTYNLVLNAVGGGGTGYRIAGGGLELYNCHPSNPLGTAAVNSGNGTTANISPASNVGDVVYSFGFCEGGTSMSPGSGQTQHGVYADSFFGSCASWEVAATSPETSSYSLSLSVNWTVLGIAIKGLAGQNFRILR